MTDGKLVDTVMLGRFVAQYEEGAAGFFIDADEAQEVALQVKAALGLGEAIMDEVHADLSIPTDVACKVYQAIKRASRIATRPEQPSGMREALEFYAKENNWRSCTVYMCGHGAINCNAMADKGAKARAALSQQHKGDGR